MMGLEKTGRIGRVLIDPRNPDVVFACALGHAYGPQPERGVFRTDDGGKNWQQVLNVDENTGCSDIVMDPNNSHILFAGMWQLELHTWNRTSGGPGSGLYKSTDGGVTWKHLTGHGLPNSPLGKIGVAMARENSSRVYALIETGDGIPCDGKPTYARRALELRRRRRQLARGELRPQLAGRAAYYTRCAVAPDNENEIYFMTAAFSRSLDGGRTLTDLPALPGGDNHDMWIDPTNGDRMMVANDSGVSISVNRGQHLEPRAAPHRADVPRHRRQPDSLFRLRQQAGRHVVSRSEQQPVAKARRSDGGRGGAEPDLAQRLAPGRPAARAASPRPIRWTRTSSGRARRAPAAWAAS